MVWLTHTKKRTCCSGGRQGLLSIGLITLVLTVFGCGESSKTDQNKFDGSAIAIDSTERAAQPVDTAEAGSEFDSTLYEDWLEYSDLKVRLKYPSDHPFASSMEDMARGYNAAIRRDVIFLGLEEFTDTLIIYYYASNEQGSNATGHDFPFATKDAVHFWQLNYYGPSLMDYMLNYWQESEPEYRFLKEGIMAILDYSGNNYHDYTKKSMLDSTVVHIDSLSSVPKSGWFLRGTSKACSASFVDFVAYYFGSSTLKQLYTSTGSFTDNVEDIFGMDPDSLQTLWLSFVNVAVPDTLSN